MFIKSKRRKWYVFEIIHLKLLFFIVNLINKVENFIFTYDKWYWENIYQQNKKKEYKLKAIYCCNQETENITNKVHFHLIFTFLIIFSAPYQKQKFIILRK